MNCVETGQGKSWQERRYDAALEFRERCITGVVTRSKTMTMSLKKLSDAVLELVPTASRVDVSLILRTHEPTSYREEVLTEVLAEISVWHVGKYYGLDAPTYEQALAKFKAELLPKIFPVKPVEPAPAMERLAAMEAGTPCSTP